MKNGTSKIQNSIVKHNLLKNDFSVKYVVCVEVLML